VGDGPRRCHSGLLLFICGVAFARLRRARLFLAAAGFPPGSPSIRGVQKEVQPIRDEAHAVPEHEADESEDCRHEDIHTRLRTIT